jgi:hypothetical protein
VGIQDGATITMIISPWCAVNPELLLEASRVLKLEGTLERLFIDGEFLVFYKHGEDWFISKEGWGEPGNTGCYAGSCMSAERVEPILKKLIKLRYPKQLDLFCD